jgi:MFS family permease
MSSTVFSILSWILLITADNVAQMYIARLLQGFTIGFVMTSQIIYIGEIASDDCRFVFYFQLWVLFYI